MPSPSRSPALRPRPGRRERRRIETRERLFRAAARLFAARGFDATTVEDITEAADVGKGTFFNYFPSKEHVLGVLGEMQRTKIARAVEETRNSTQPLRSILRRLIHALGEEPGRSQALFRSLLSAILSNKAVRELITDNIDHALELVAELMAAGQKRGEVRHNASPRELAALLQRAAFGSLVLWSLREGEDLDRRLDEIFRAYWLGVEVQRRGPGRAKG